MKAAFVWPMPTTKKIITEDMAMVGTHYLGSVCGIDDVWWVKGKQPPDKIMDYDCFIVNLFRDMRHVTQIRAMHPTAYIVALPDNAFEQVFTQTSTHDMLFLEQLQAADCIGYISESNRQFYGALFPNKPMIKIPIVIGHPKFFETMRQQYKEDFIITCDHSIWDSDDGEMMIDATCIQNVAVCAAIQRATGLRVVYVNAAPKTRQFAEIVGLQALFTAYLNFATYVELTSRARLGVDMYTLHGFGRNTLMYAYAGTPAVGSSYSEFNVTAIDPWLPEYAVEAANRLLSHSDNYRSAGIERVENENGFDACRKQMTAVLEQVDTWRRLPQPS